MSNLSLKYVIHISDASQMKVDPYESATFQQEMEATWQGLKPLYEQVSRYLSIISTHIHIHHIYSRSCTRMSGTSCTASTGTA